MDSLILWIGETGSMVIAMVFLAVLVLTLIWDLE
jgi:hypothetical protein